MLVTSGHSHDAQDQRSFAKTELGLVVVESNSTVENLPAVGGVGPDSATSLLTTCYAANRLAGSTPLLPLDQLTTN
jgi:hypothetical protein